MTEKMPAPDSACRMCPGGDRRPRRILQLRPVERVELEAARQVDRATVHRDVAGREAQLAHQQLQHLLADRLRPSSKVIGATEPAASKSTANGHVIRRLLLQA